MNSEFIGYELKSVVGIVPSSKEFFDDEIENYPQERSSSLKLKELMGYNEHRIAKDSTTMSDMAIHGINHLVKNGLLNLNEIDGIVFVSQTPDYLLPPTSSFIHGKLNLGVNTYCVDINDGCNGFIKGLFESLSFLQSSKSQNVILIAGDVLSRRVSKKDRNSYPLIGDAATVSIIRKTGSDAKIKIRIENDGRGFDKLIIPAGGAKLLSDANTAKQEADSEGNIRSLDNLVMNGRDVFAFTQTKVPQFIKEVTKDFKKDIDSYDKVFFHQANAFIIKKLRQKLNLTPSQAPDFVLRNFGNSSSGTIPMSIANTKFEKSLSQCFLCGFGVGLSWGCADIKFSNEIITGVIEYEEE